MPESTLAQRIHDPAVFNVLVEFTCPAGQPPSKLLSFIERFRAAPPTWDGVEISGITVTQNPGGGVSASPTDVLSHVLLRGGFGGLEYLPHVSAKGMNLLEIETLLGGLTSLGVENCFVVTGDKPVGAVPVFEADSLNLLETIRRMNADAVVDAGPVVKAGTLWPGVAVGLAKYEEASCIQQLIKLEKKIRLGGAGFVITNLLFDSRKVEEFFRYLKERNLTTPVLGNVFLLGEPAARRMLDEKLPGVYVGPDLYERVREETREDHVLRAARQTAMWRDLGAAGVDLGNVEDLDLARRIIDLALEIGPGWREAVDSLSFPPPGDDLFYLYTSSGERSPLRVPSVPHRRKVLHWVHDRFFERDTRGYQFVKSLLERSEGLKRSEGLLYEISLVMERVGKGPLARCRSCGDCFLPENFYVCVMGECAKGLPNVPCGDSTVDGRCGLEPDKPCAGRLVYDACRYFTDDISDLYGEIQPPKKPELRDTPSVANFFLEADHRRRPPLILVAELLHASIPKVRESLRLVQAREGGFDADGPGMEYLGAVVEAQALRRPAFIDANIDDVGEGDSEKAARLMREMIRLIHRHGRGVPPCIDSSDAAVIRAGLEEYYRLRPSSAAPPLINSANRERRDFVWELSGIGPFNVVYMVMGGVSAGDGSGRLPDPADLEREALEFFREATRRGFEPSRIFFDTTVVPLAIEFTRFDGPGFNHVSLNGLGRIMSNVEMRGVNSILGITNLVKDFPQGRKIGLLRAYLKLAMEAGLTAAIVDVRQGFGVRGPEDEEIVDIVRAFVDQDGSAGAYDRMNQAYVRYRAYGGRRGSAP
jgi:5-methyltetrahydrofolate corrinoid/iron sulfur protein methyltransferase